MIAAVVLAAGLSRRMGQPKMVLPWGRTTVIGQVVLTLSAAGVEDICVVTGGARQKVEAVLQELPPELPIHSVFNPDYDQGEMTLSLKVGLLSLQPSVQAALVVLGDQPQIEANTVRSILAVYMAHQPPLIVPSYQMRRGHPWLIRRDLWPAVSALLPGETLRDFLNQQSSDIRYLLVDNRSVLFDLDTPEDYQEQRPDSG